MQSSEGFLPAQNRFLQYATKIPLFWRFQIGGWLAFSLLSFPLKWVILQSIPGSILVSLFRDGLGFLLTLGMRLLYRKVYHPKMHLGWVAVLIIGVSVVGGVILTAFTLAFHGIFDFEEDKVFNGAFIFGVFYFRMALCMGWSLLYFGIKLVLHSIDRELGLAQAVSARQKAELQMLRTQMNPHFLFNALTTIRAGLGKSETNLKGVIQALADYLRYALEHRNDDQVPMEKEFEAAASYLAVEKARYRDELEIDLQIDEGVKEALVPGVMLQPLVENAIKYGRTTSSLPLKVRVRVTRPTEKMVRAEVSNTGKWKTPIPNTKGGGIGLSNLRHRLSLLYPQTHRFDVCSENEWVTVQVELPYTA